MFAFALVDWHYKLEGGWEQENNWKLKIENGGNKKGGKQQRKKQLISVEWWIE